MYSVQGVHSVAEMVMERLFTVTINLLHMKQNTGSRRHVYQVYSWGQNWSSFSLLGFPCFVSTPPSMYLAVWGITCCEGLMESTLPSFPNNDYKTDLHSPTRIVSLLTGEIWMLRSSPNGIKNMLVVNWMEANNDFPVFSRCSSYFLFWRSVKAKQTLYLFHITNLLTWTDDIYMRHWLIQEDFSYYREILLREKGKHSHSISLNNIFSLG